MKTEPRGGCERWVLDADQAKHAESASACSSYLAAFFDGACIYDERITFDREAARLAQREHCPADVDNDTEGLSPAG